jgi:hypothetical protein
LSTIKGVAVDELVQALVAAKSGSDARDAQGSLLSETMDPGLRRDDVIFFAPG